MQCAMSVAIRIFFQLLSIPKYNGNSGPEEVYKSKYTLIMRKYNHMITTKKINDWLHDEVFARLETALRCNQNYAEKKIAKQINSFMNESTGKTKHFND